MIEIRMETPRLKLMVTGHAKKEENADFSAICTAVSVLAQGLAYTFGKIGRAMKSVQYRNDPGDLFLMAMPEEFAKAVAREKFKTYGDGLEMLAKAHPECVGMVWDGERIIPEEEQ